MDHGYKTMEVFRRHSRVTEAEPKTIHTVAEEEVHPILRIGISVDIRIEKVTGLTP